MKLLNIGFGNMVNADRIIGIVSRILRLSSVWCRMPAKRAH